MTYVRELYPQYTELYEYVIHNQTHLSKVNFESY
jgi:hypothetical protein